VLKISLKRLGTSQDVQIVNDGAPAQIEEILAHSQIPCTVSLPLPHMGKGMLNRDPLAQFGSPFPGLLTLA
jgi:hypothetical protein